jgi:O-antigen/teichoic acid export membrane protein
VPKFKLFNLKGDLFATGFSFSAQAVIKLVSSMILTRILRPEAYGIITIIMSIVFVVELLADINVTLFIIRDASAEQPRYLNTAWTMRLGRAVINSAILFICATFFANTIYHAPALITPLRVFSVSFIIGGLESMAFPLALRRKQARIIMYSELIATFLSTAFSIVYCHFSRDYWGILYGILLNRLLITVFSYRFYPEFRPKIHFDRAAAREILKFTKFTMPSSLLTIAMTQFDKVVFLRLFDLKLLGLYGVAGNIALPIDSLISKISNLVLYPRCAHNFRTDRDTFSLKYYTENVRLFFSILIVPAAIGGGAHLLIAVLYDPRYAQAGDVLQAFMLRAMLLSLATPSEDLLIAAGESHVMLVGNLFRATGMFAMSLTGYYFFGFLGFTYGVALSALTPLIYYWRLQRKRGMMIAKYELLKISFASCVAIAAYAVSGLLLAFLPMIRAGIRHSS